MEAHQDARSFFSQAYPRTLDPRTNGILGRAHDSYPALVERLTLAGFFGEVVATAIAQIYDPHGRLWRIPALCFRYHDHLFRELVRAAESEREPGRAVGRLGDDCIAFSIDETGDALAAVLLCEAKCSYTHRAASVSEGQASLARTSRIQIEFFKIIQILRDRAQDGDANWIRAIEQFRDTRTSVIDSKYDLLTYVFGSPPASGTRIPTDRKIAHDSPCDLVAVEVHLHELEMLAKGLYMEAFGHAAI